MELRKDEVDLIVRALHTEYQRIVMIKGEILLSKCKAEHSVKVGQEMYTIEKKISAILSKFEHLKNFNISIKE